MKVIEQIVKLATPYMSAFESDLEHDRSWIEANPGAGFIHVTRQTGTHIIALPTSDSLVDDSPIPHLFGMARPSEVYRQQRELLKGQLTVSGSLWLLYDGKSIRKTGSRVCIEVFETKVRVAETHARKRSSDYRVRHVA